MILLINSINTNITLTLLSKEGKVKNNIKWKSNQDLSEKLLLMIEDILERANISYQKLSAIVVLIGPGSYTNLRITMAVANIFNYILKIPLYGISLFDLKIYELLKKIKLTKEIIIKIIWHSAYSDLLKSFQIKILKNKKIFVKEIASNKAEMNKSLEELVIEQENNKLNKLQIISFIQEVIIQKKAIFEHIKPQKILLPIYYAPPIITKRKKTILEENLNTK